MTQHAFKVLTRPQYYHQLVEDINATKPGDTIRLATMGFEPEKRDILPILDALNAAAKRGADVHLFVDAMVYLIGSHNLPGPLVALKKLPKHLPHPFSLRRDLLEKLRRNGGQYTVINNPSRPWRNPLAGRSHIKLAIVNNTIYTGGCNLTEIDHLDLMVRWHDKRTSEWLTTTLLDTLTSTKNVQKTLAKKDVSFPVDQDTTLLIDCGKPKQSLIFDKTLALIDQAKEHILITCQYFPDGIVAKHLQAAHNRGVDVKIIFNSPAGHYFPFNVLVAATLLNERRHLSPELFAHVLPKQHDYLHAKLLVTDQGTIVGSHNFVPTGVNFGTAEIALLTHNDHFTQQLLSVLYSQLTP